MSVLLRIEDSRPRDMAGALACQDDVEYCTVECAAAVADGFGKRHVIVPSLRSSGAITVSMLSDDKPLFLAWAEETVIIRRSVHQHLELHGQFLTTGFRSRHTLCL